MVRVLAISGSPRRKGNTEILCLETLEGAKEVGAEIEFDTVARKDISGCDGCFTCGQKGICHIKDDAQPMFEKMNAADGIIFATPVYHWNMTGQMKCFLDRCMSMGFPTSKLALKVTGIIAVTARDGDMNAIQAFWGFIHEHHMLGGDWISAYGNPKGDVRNDKYAMAGARVLGKEVALFAKNVKESGINYPEPYRRSIYSSVVIHTGQQIGVWGTGERKVL